VKAAAYVEKLVGRAGRNVLRWTLEEQHLLAGVTATWGSSCGRRMKPASGPFSVLSCVGFLESHPAPWVVIRTSPICTASYSRAVGLMSRALGRLLDSLSHAVKGEVGQLSSHTTSQLTRAVPFRMSGTVRAAPVQRPAPPGHPSGRQAGRDGSTGRCCWPPRRAVGRAKRARNVSITLRHGWLETKLSLPPSRIG
jgi:hypothetical protein